MAFPKIRINNDPESVYKSGEVISAEQLLTSFVDCTNDKSLADWLYVIPIPAAIDFMAKAWGIDYTIL